MTKVKTNKQNKAQQAEQTQQAEQAEQADILTLEQIQANVKADNVPGRMTILRSYNQKAVSVSELSVACFVCGHELPSEEELRIYAPTDVKKAVFGMNQREQKAAKVDYLKTPVVEQAKDAIMARYTAERQAEREVKVKAVENAKTAEQNAKEQWQKARENTALADKALAEFDSSILGEQADTKAKTLDGRLIDLAVKLTADNVEFDYASKQAKSKAGTPTAERWPVDSRWAYTFEKADDRQGEQQTVEFSIVSLTKTGARVKSIEIHTLPEWYNGKLKAGEIATISPNKLFANHLKAKMNVPKAVKAVENEQAEQADEQANAK